MITKRLGRVFTSDEPLDQDKPPVKAEWWHGARVSCSNCGFEGNLESTDNVVTGTSGTRDGIPDVHVTCPTRNCGFVLYAYAETGVKQPNATI